MSAAVAEAPVRLQNTMRSCWRRTGGVSSLDTTSPASRSRRSATGAVAASKPDRCASAASAAPRGHKRSTDKIALSQGSRASAGVAAGTVIAVTAVGSATVSRVVAADDGAAGQYSSGRCRSRARNLNRSPAGRPVSRERTEEPTSARPHRHHLSPTQPDQSKHPNLST